MNSFTHYLASVRRAFGCLLILLSIAVVSLGEDRVLFQSPQWSQAWLRGSMRQQKMMNAKRTGKVIETDVWSPYGLSGLFKGKHPVREHMQNEGSLKTNSEEPVRRAEAGSTGQSKQSTTPDNKKNVTDTLSFPENCVGGCEQRLITEHEDSVSLYVGTNQSVYRFGDVLVGTGHRWEEDRNSIISSPEFNNTVMQLYFHTRPHWERREVDFPMLGKICNEGWSQHKPSEDLVIHFRNGDNIFDSYSKVVTCAKEFHKAHYDANTTGVPLRLVTIQHYGANAENGLYFATNESIQKGNAIAQHLIDDLFELGFDVHVQSSADADVDFCTMLQASEVCLSLGSLFFACQCQWSQLLGQTFSLFVFCHWAGGFDSVVNAVRGAIGFPQTQSNFEDVPYGYFAQHSKKVAPVPNKEKTPNADDEDSVFQSGMYLYGDSVFGLTPNWKAERQAIARQPAYKGTLLERYFKDKKPVHVDGPLLLDLCQTHWGTYAPVEDVVIHHRTNHISSLLDCAEHHYQNLTARTNSHKPTVRVVTVHHLSGNVQTLTDDLQAMGYTTFVQSSASLLTAAGVASDAASESAAAATEVGLASEDNIAGAAAAKELVASLTAAQTAGTLAKNAAEAMAAASADIDFCTLLQANRLCLEKSAASIDRLLKTVKKQVHQSHATMNF